LIGNNILKTLISTCFRPSKYYCESNDNFVQLVAKIVETELPFTEWKI